jgi:hypothetical protein
MFESGDVGHLLIETAEGLVVVDVVRDVVQKIFEVTFRIFPFLTSILRARRLWCDECRMEGL